MSNLSWTNEQKQAIECPICNTIVSAGAGSGKTAVLTERIFEHLSRGIDIDRLLVLTFTKAAATSMKDKTKEKIVENAGNKLNKDFRKKQLDKIDGSYIMTFDAFALSLVKKYHYLLNVSDDINIIDENVLRIKREEILEKIFNEKYTEKDANFLEMIDAFCIKDDSSFREAIIKIDDQMDLIIDREGFTENYFDNFFNLDFIKKQVEEFRKTSLDLHQDIKRWLKELESLLDGHEANFIVNDIPKLHEYVEEKSEEQLKKASAELKIGQMRIKSEIDEETKDEAGFYKTRITDAVKEINEIFALEKNQDIENILNTRKYVEVVLDIIKKLNEQTNNFKVEKDLYSYMDISKMSIKIVKENENIRQEIKDYFREILIDEYQDNSDIQEEFINLISNNNVFVVGDIKQSIYGFRNANPLNFQNKYDKCKDSNFGKTIDLNKNFRSRTEAIDSINKIFSRIMDKEIGGVDYDHSQAMQFGQNKYSDNHISDKYHQTEIIVYETEGKQEFVDERGKAKIESIEVYPFANNEYSKEEVEAMIIAEDIKKKIKDKFKVLDDKTLRDAKHGDFCIMAETKKHFDLFNEILSAEAIPVKVEREVQISEMDVIKVIKRIFMLITDIANGKKDIEVIKHCYASIERSFLMENDDENIYETISTNKIKDSASYQKCSKISLGIKEKTTLEVFNEIIQEFNFYEKLHLIGDVELNIAVLEYVADLANQLGQIGYSYADFTVHLEKILTDDKKKLEFKLNQFEDNTVKIMSIHNSKGLEFPICYYPSLFKGFNFSDAKGDYLFSKERGIILPTKYYENGKYLGLKETILKGLFKRDRNRELVSEKIRLFYVALTRAKEKIIMICPLGKTLAGFKDGVVENKTRVAYKSFLSMLNSIYDFIIPYVREIDLVKDVKISKDYLKQRKEVFKNLKKSKEKIVVKEFEPIVPSLIEKGKFSKDVSVIDQETKDVMEHGTKLHYFMELIDLKNPNYAIIEEPFKMKVKNFIESDLLKDVKKAEVIKELEFVYQQDKKQKHGFIDLLLEYEDKFVIIDYKVKNIDDESYDLQLLGYKEYLQSISEKEVECYLYSLMESNYRQVK